MLLRLFLLFALGGQTALAADFSALGTPPTWQQLFDQAAPDVTFAVELRGPSPYSRNPSLAMKPASVSKLFTIGAALSRLGADFRYETKVEWTLVRPNDDSEITGLTVTGEGDPSWGMSEFGETTETRVRDLVKQLVSRGVRSVHGPLLLRAADPRWTTPRYPEGWNTEDQLECYGALAQAFNLQINCAVFVVTGPTTGYFEERDLALPVQVRLGSGAATDLKVSKSGAGYQITGSWRPGTKAQTVVLPVTDPTAWIANLLFRVLKENRIAYDPAPIAMSLVSRQFIGRSPPLSELMVPFLKLSLNFMGDAFLRTLGSRVGPGSLDLLASGQQVLADYVRDLGLRDVSLLDGSGLSHDSAVTATSVLTLLENLKTQPEYHFLWDALPIAGRDGTLTNRMKGTAAEGVLRAKTGTLSGVYNLAGYVPALDSSGHITGFVPFVMLTQSPAGRGAEIHAIQDRAGAKLVESLARAGGRLY